MLLKESVDTKNERLNMVLLNEEDKQPDLRQKKRQGAEDLHSLEPQKAHPTGEFVIVA